MLLHNQCKLIHTIDLTSDLWLTYFVFVQRLWEQYSPDPRNKGYSYIATNTLHHNCVHLAIIQSLMKEIKSLGSGALYSYFLSKLEEAFAELQSDLRLEGIQNQHSWKKLAIFSLSSKHEVYLSSSCYSRGKKKEEKNGSTCSILIFRG